MRRTTQNTTYALYGPKLLELDETYALAGCLGTNLVEAGGYIALVIAFGILGADDSGIIDGFTNKAIETACYWTGERGALIESFLVCNVLTGEHESDENPLRIAPALWATVAGKAIEKRIQARERKQKERQRKAGGK